MEVSYEEYLSIINSLDHPDEMIDGITFEDTEELELVGVHGTGVNLLSNQYYYLSPLYNHLNVDALKGNIFQVTGKGNLSKLSLINVIGIHNVGEFTHRYDVVKSVISDRFLSEITEENFNYGMANLREKRDYITPIKKLYSNISIPPNHIMLLLKDKYVIRKI